MKFGYLSLNHAAGLAPDKLARLLEERGFDSIWLPEHSHIPVSRDTPYPGGGDLPDGYWNMMDPFVSLTAAAGATKHLKLCTGICLLLEHDLLDLACTAATLDFLTHGRVVLGVGVGWNKEELANHRPELKFRHRYRAMRERVSALRTIWTKETPSFDGTWDRFTKSWVYPKPSQQPIPIALGNAGPLGIQHAAEYADEWIPIDASLVALGGPAAGIQLFKEKAEEAGRDPDTIPISLFLWGAPSERRLEEYRELGVSRVVVPPPTMSASAPDETPAYLDSLIRIMAEFAA